MTAPARRPPRPPPASPYTAPQPPSLHPVSLDDPSDGPLRWYEHTPGLEAELVLSGATRAAVDGLVAELGHVDEFMAAGLDAPTRVLFVGPSGTGKTLTARAIGSLLGRRMGVLDVAATVGKFLGDTGNNLAAAFRHVATAGFPSLLLLDEVDALCMSRDTEGGGAGASELKRATTTFLQQLDWLPATVIVLAATNYRDALDDALRRRFTTEIAFGLPDREARARMIGRWLGRSPVTPEQIDRLVEATEGLSGADLRSRAMAVGRSAVMAAAPPPAKPKTRAEYARDAVAAVQRDLEGVS